MASVKDEGTYYYNVIILLLTVKSPCSVNHDIMV
jgi:hypothetical protein